jgi:N-acetylmuramoyl-L-alanine amidase
MLLQIALQEKLDESREFATHIHASLKKMLAKGQRAKFDRGVKRAPFVVLIGAKMPAVLAEISFLSNPREEERLRTGEHRQKIAEALFNGISSYAETLSGIKVAQDGKNEPTQTASRD